MTSGSLASHDRRPVALTYHNKDIFLQEQLFRYYNFPRRPVQGLRRGGGGGIATWTYLSLILYKA